MKPKKGGVSFPSPSKSGGGGGSEGTAGWEVRPGGMFVQKRSKDSHPPAVCINVKVKFGSSYHGITLSSQASFGELKKVIAGRIGLHPEEQKLMFKEKERDSRAFLDVVGVRDGSKIVVIENELSKEKRLLESRKNAKMEKASKEIAAIRFEVDMLAKQVATVESTVSNGKKVEEMVASNMIESLMIQLIKLDGISADGETKLQRRMQVRRVQKYIEILDVLKIRNSRIAPVPSQRQQEKLASQHPTTTSPGDLDRRKQGNFSEIYNPRRVVVTTKWETF